MSEPSDPDLPFEPDPDDPAGPDMDSSGVDLTGMDLSGMDLDALELAEIQRDLASSDEDDPEFSLYDHDCEHPFDALGNLEDETGFGCMACGEHWHVSDEETCEAVSVLWGSSAAALDELTGRLASLERFAAEALGARSCVCCGELVAATQLPESAVLVGVEVVPGVWACPDHVAGAAGHHDLDEEVDDLDEHLCDWVAQSGLVASEELTAQWRLERLVAARPGLAHRLGDSSEAASARVVELHDKISSVLSLPSTCSLGELSCAVASLLDLPAPTTRTTRGYLVGLAAVTQRVLVGGHRHDTTLDEYDLDPRERTVRECHAEVALPSPDSRDVVALELLSDGEPATADPDLIAARSLLHAITDRAITELLERGAPTR